MPDAAIRFTDVSFVYQATDEDARGGGDGGCQGDVHLDTLDTPNAQQSASVCQGARPPDNHNARGGVRNVSFAVQPGECVVLCGKSGCGKTTVTRLINGLAPHFYPGELTGVLEVCDSDVTEMNLAGIARLVGSVFQNPRSQFFNVDTNSELAFGCENLALERAEMLERMREATDTFALEGLLGRSIFELSGGEKQRVACGSVYAMRPRIYLLDEPSSNLDLVSVAQLRDALRRLKRQGATIVVAEHRLHYLTGLADRYLYFENGRIRDEFTAERFEGMPDDERARRGLRGSKLDCLVADASHNDEHDKRVESLSSSNGYQFPSRGGKGANSPPAEARVPIPLPWRGAPAGGGVVQGYKHESVT